MHHARSGCIFHVVDCDCEWSRRRRWWWWWPHAASACRHSRQSLWQRFAGARNNLCATIYSTTAVGHTTTIWSRMKNIRRWCNRKRSECILLWQTANQAFHCDECDEYEKLAAATAAKETMMRYPNTIAERATKFQNAISFVFGCVSGENGLCQIFPTLSRAHVGRNAFSTIIHGGGINLSHSLWQFFKLISMRRCKSRRPRCIYRLLMTVSKGIRTCILLAMSIIINQRHRRVCGVRTHEHVRKLLLVSFESRSEENRFLSKFRIIPHDCAVQTMGMSQLATK